MSFWSKLLSRNEHKKPFPDDNIQKEIVSFDLLPYAFVDVEVGIMDQKLHDIGALRYDGALFHKTSISELRSFLKNVQFICGHNIVHHDVKYLFPDKLTSWILVDTLYMSPLLFPERPYHKLTKDEKLLTDQMNNPVSDCYKAKQLLLDEIARWNTFSHEKKMLLFSLLRNKREFSGFFSVVEHPHASDDIASLIRALYAGKICENAPIQGFIDESPCALAYALALIDTTNYRSITPSWVLYQYPEVEWILRLLCFTQCKEACSYCHTKLDVHAHLKTLFGYDQFRTYDGEPLQENAVQAALQEKSLLAIFPTGGGKSLTFQLPALMAGQTLHGLTVVISPLQSLMKDQVDNLTHHGIDDAVAINGLLDPIARAEALSRVQNGDASLLYIAPEMLRSNTIERILLARNVVRFVIDEAHCFSAWGQDFRVDYLYIGKFIANYQEKKGCVTPIPISCFTATAKQKVIQDICDYFKKNLGLELALFTSKASRTNLHYSVIHVDDDESKYQRLRSLVTSSDCPTIVYVSRTKRTEELAKRLSRDGFKALPFHGKLAADVKSTNQDAFMNNHVNLIVATSAFGMGVDKKDVGMVIHYDISDSLENYVQEAGRAGRDPLLSARCYVLYCDDDLNKHFILLNQTKISISEIQQVWKALKELTKQRMTINCSALEIARKAGWDDSVADIEMRVRTAISALEQSGYIARGNNVPHVYATGITVKNMDEARQRITDSILFEKEEVDKAARIIKSLLSQKYTAKSNRNDANAESRIDYLADHLGMTKGEVISVVERMRQVGILADSKDLSAYLKDTDSSERKTRKRLEECSLLENFILHSIQKASITTTTKKLNDDAIKSNIASAREKDIHTLLHFLTIKKYISKKNTDYNTLEICSQTTWDNLFYNYEKRIHICRFIVSYLYDIAHNKKDTDTINQAVTFSEVELLKQYKSQSKTLFPNHSDTKLEDIEEALLYLSSIDALRLEGGFFILYKAMNIQRLKDSRLQYKKGDYAVLDEFYKQKIQQIHIIGEYANLMVRDYPAALQFVHDYFQSDHKQFIDQYFKGSRALEIKQNLTPRKYHQLFGQLSEKQMEIISNKESRCIVVAAGPGSGKTRVLVHKLTSLLLLEDVKNEQLLMLTFSRAAATEFKQRLIALIGNAAHFVEIKTFHSYSFDLLGRIGNNEDVENVVETATAMINNGEVEPSRIGKTVLVIDEAQDMSKAEYELIRALMRHNETMRLIAVGDDDQNIYEFRGANSQFMMALTQEQGSQFVEMTENYRSAHHIVDFANSLTNRIEHRLKSTPILSKRPHNGYVEIVQHTTQHLFQPLVNHLLSQDRQGSCCILTQTNEDAAIIMALLKHHGLPCKLIQSLENIHFCNIAEVRFFMRQIYKTENNPLISNENWEEAKKKTFNYYEKSTFLPFLKNCIASFERNNATKYHNDLWDFIMESSLEDFYDLSGNEIVVSTIHKSKGREFDDVYMLLSNHIKTSNEQMRRYYVGATRAKNRLFIHTNNDYFSTLPANKHTLDTHNYDLPNEVILQLSLKDVYLDYFKDKKQNILRLRSGDQLSYRNFCLYLPCDKPLSLAKLSTRMKDTLQDWTNRGYEVTDAHVRFIVAWKPKETAEEGASNAHSEEEFAVLLADLKLKIRDSYHLLKEKEQQNH